MAQQVTLREICDMLTKYRLGSKDPKVVLWYHRLKTTDDLMIDTLHEYIQRKKIQSNR